MIIPTRAFDPAEVDGLSRRFAERDIQVLVAAPEPDEAVGAGDVRLRPDLRVHDARIDDFDGIVVAGGDGARALWGDRDVLQLIWGAALQHKPVGAIGMAAPLPAQASLLVDRRAACAPDEAAIAELRKHHGVYEDLSAVASDNGIVTASGVGGLDEFVHLFMDQLARARDARFAA